MIVCLNKLLLFWPPKEGGLDIEYNLFCVCKIESISPPSLNFISCLVSVCCIHNFVRMLYFLYTIPIDFFVSL